MKSKYGNSHTLTERLDRIERKNRKLATLAVAPWLILGAVVLTGQSARTPDVIEARKIVLKDAKGLETVEIKGDDKDCGIRVTGGLHTLGYSTSLRPEGLFLMYVDGSEHNVVSLNPDRMLWLGGDARDFLQLVPNGLMIGGRGSSAVSILGEKGAGSVVIRDSNGYSAVLGKADLEDQRTGETVSTSAGSIVIFDRKGKVVWKEP